MRLSEILAISGQPGLYKFVAQSKSGIIVESLADGRRMPVQGTSKVSTLSDIAIFTTSEDLPLGEVLAKMFSALEGKEVMNHKSDAKLLKEEMGRLIPEYDEDRVYISDIKKLFSWYNILVGAGMDTFVEKEEQEEAESAE